jgi:galactose mutarotase-like enzyme
MKIDMRTCVNVFQNNKTEYRSMFVGNKIAGKNTAIDGEIRRLPALNENTVLHSNIKDFQKKHIKC